MFNMYETFAFNGVSSDMYRVLMNTEWLDISPSINYEKIDIEGRDGALYEELNFKDVNRSVACTMLNREYLPQIIRWLKGDGLFEFNGRYRQARIYDQIDFNPIGIKHASFTIPFIFEPFWYKKDQFAQYTNIVRNNGDVYSVPVIRLKGAGDGSVTINGLTFGVSFDGDQQIVIDCKEKNEDKPKCVTIGFEYPTLKPGENEISYSGGITSIEIMRKDRWYG